MAINVAQIHPDGLLLGTGGADRNVYIWDIKEAKSVAEFTGHTAPVNNMAFSENGYYMATTAEDNTVRLWDLRMKKILNFKTFEYDSSYNPHAVAFDYSGTYMAVAGKDVRCVCAGGHWRFCAGLCALACCSFLPQGTSSLAAVYEEMFAELTGRFPRACGA